VPEYEKVHYDSDVSPHVTDFQKSKYLKTKNASYLDSGAG
jgi:hypothetical protein